MSETFMKERPVLPLLLSMSLPMVLSMLVNALYNIVDSFFVAQISETAMTALSLVFPLQNLINAVGIGFGIGVGAVISYCLGADERQQADCAASLGLALALLHGLVLTVICIGTLPTFLALFTNDTTVQALGIRYGQVAFLFTLANAAAMAFEKIFQAVGRMKVTMVSLGIGCITNIILDPMFIFGLGPFPALGIEGAALATGLGQTLSLLIYLIIYRLRPLSVHITRRALRPERHLIKRLYAIGVPATLNLALPSLLISALNAILATYSAVYVLVLGIYYKLQTFLYLPANGIIQGMRPLIGYNYGAGEHARVRKIFTAVLIMSGGIMLLGTLLCFVAPDAIMRLFTHTPTTIAAGATALRTISCGFIVSAVSVTCSGALEGLGKGFPSLIISLCRYLLLILPLAFILSRFLGPEGVWHAFWLTETASALVSLVVYRRALRA